MKLASWVYWKLDDVKRAAKRRGMVESVRKTGIDIVLCVWGTDEIPANATAIEKLVAELADVGAELHIGSCPFSRAKGVPRRRLYQYQEGGKQQYGGLCPSWPENRELVLRNLRRICRSVRVPGLHLDFIRYLFSAGTPWKLEWESGREWIDTYHWCQCEACRTARAKWLSRPHFTTYDRLHPGVTFKELEFRKRNVEDVFRRIRQITDQHELQLSIA